MKTQSQQIVNSLINWEKAIEEVKNVEWSNKLKWYQDGYRPDNRYTGSAFIKTGDIVLAVIAEDSFVIGKVINDPMAFYDLKILVQIGETYHNGDDDTVCVNDFEIWEVLN